MDKKQYKEVKKLTKFSERAHDSESKRIFNVFYAQNYFRTTEELRSMKSVINSKIVNRNIIVISMSMFTSCLSVFICLINNIASAAEDDIGRVSVVFVITLFVVAILSLVYAALDGIDEGYFNNNRKLRLMLEAIEKNN